MHNGYCEIDSFVLKFRNLCHAGFKASLTLEAENGKAVVSLKAGLGHLPVPFILPPPHGQRHHFPNSHRGPAYQRRQERRKAAAKQQHEAEKAHTSIESLSDTNDETPEDDDEVVEKATVVEEMNTNKDAEKATETKIVEEEDINKEADQANENTECIICGFKSKWHNGLKIHMSKMHRNIEQMD